jgi:aryl-alcohol dehydrogenase-like predicted oxidoreductase
MTKSFPELCLGGNVFGWTADESQSFDVLDAARAAGITFIDTADVYAAWVNDGKGGQSEEIIGRWAADRGVRDELTIATKVGSLPGLDDLRPDTIRRGAENSLARLQTDRIDLFYAHKDDGGDLAEALGGFDALVRAGSVRMVGLSNFSGERIREALDICARDGLTEPVALQPRYSLMERGFETSGERDTASEAGLAVLPYYALASGFLTGKYRPGAGDNGSGDSPRAGSATAYLDEPRGPAVLEALDASAEAHDVPVASIALAWLRAQPTVASPIASARTVEQIEPLAKSIGLELDAAELDALDVASQPG